MRSTRPRASGAPEVPLRGFSSPAFIGKSARGGAAMGRGRPEVPRAATTLFAKLGGRKVEPARKMHARPGGALFPDPWSRNSDRMPSSLHGAFASGGGALQSKAEKKVGAPLHP